jgi:hypothetical protein
MTYTDILKARRSLQILLLKECGSHVPGVSIIPGITNVIASPVLAQNQKQIEFTLGMKAALG